MKKFAKDLERGDHIFIDGRYQTIVTVDVRPYGAVNLTYRLSNFMSTRDSFLNVEPEDTFDVIYNQTWGL